MARLIEGRNAMTVTYTQNADAKSIELTVAGHVTREDHDSVIDRIQACIDTHGTIRMLETIKSVDGFDPTLLWSGLKFDIRNIRHISHVAVVSDIGWIGPMSKAAGAVISTRLRTFGLAELDAARAWIHDAD
jgi:hypothetical protein